LVTALASPHVRRIERIRQEEDATGQIGFLRYRLTPERTLHPEQLVGVRLSAIVPAVIGLLQREGRVSYRSLAETFGFDQALMECVKQELLFKRVAYDEQGNGLVWIGAALATTPPVYAPDPGGVPDDSKRTLIDTVLKAEPAALELMIQQPLASPPEAERWQLTVLFCDLVGSTQLSGQLDPEDLRAVGTYQEAAAEVIQHYAGYIAQYLGDGLLVYFGYPTAHEDEARRAVHTGLGIVQAIATLNTHLALQYGMQLAVRLGIHTGPVVVGQMGGGGRHEHLALGETPNIAARLQALAPTNAVVISAVTARLVQNTFALENLGTYPLHGVTEPMLVSRVRGLLAPPSHDEEFVTATMPVLVGREEESGLLRRRWEQSKAGLGQVVFVSGEAGIGKSALVEELRAQVRAEGLPRIAFRCSPYHTTSALYPVITHFEYLLQFAPDDPPATRLAKLETGLRPYDLPLAEVVPLLAGLLSVPLPVERYAPLTLTPQQQKQQTFDALLAWMVAEAERQPVLVAWEDLHWADPTTLELLGLVIDQAPTVPMLHVLTCRPEFSPPWPPRSHITPLVLHRLERPQVEALIIQQASGKTLPAEVVEHIVAKTDGVPLYVEELTKMLLASALLREEVDQYALTGPLRVVAIPDTLQDALMARLDQLNRAKEVAQLGAVLGREFAYALLQAIAPQEENALQEGLAHARLHEALALAHELSHPYSLAFARCYAAIVYQFRRDVPAVQEQAEAAVALSTEQGFPQWVAHGTILRGWALAMQGQGEEGMAQIRQGITSYRTTGAALNVPYFCTVLADVCDHLGHPEDSLQALAEAHTLVEQQEERYWEAEVCRLRGVLLLRQTGTPQAEAEAWLQRGLDVAHHQEAKSLELRAAMSLARLWQQQGRRAEARDLLAPLYGWFTEGFDTADLQEAKALLEELEGERRQVGAGD
jgi:class 3 adenylate cyclase